LRRFLKKYSWIDRERLGVTGGSYGGYMTNWIVSHTNMFKAAVTLRSVVNFISDDGLATGLMYTNGTFGGDIFEKFDLYWDRSPLQVGEERQDSDVDLGIQTMTIACRSSRASSGFAR